MKINFRKADLTDIDEIMILINNAILNMEKGNIYQWDNLYPTKEDFENDIRKKYLEVGEINGIIAVIYSINKCSDEQYKKGKWEFSDDSFCVIHRLCVNPDFQNTGIARKTLKHIEATQKEIGIKSIRLDVFTQNPYALSLYEHYGYKNVGYADWRKGKFLLMEKCLF